MRRFSPTLALSLMIVSGVAKAEDCDPRNFNYQDVERLSFNEVLAISAIDTMESSRAQQSGRNFNSGAVVKGVPIKLDYSDMKTISDYVKKTNDIKISRDQQINFFKSNPSIVGPTMYQACLNAKTKNFTVRIPENAYTDDEFFLTMKWTPTYNLADGQTVAPAHVAVTNGTVSGKTEDEKQVKNQQSVRFTIRRTDPKKAIQIVPDIDGYDYGEDSIIVIPPNITVNETTKLRQWPAPGEPQVATLCSDDGGGNCGSGPKVRKECIKAESGVLLPSSAGFEIEGTYYREPVKEVADGSVCYTFGTLGVETFGKKGYSVLNKFRFFVYEVVPPSQQRADAK